MSVAISGAAKGELSKPLEALALAIHAQEATKKVPLLGVTGTDGAGKSSPTDELIRRLRPGQDVPLRVAVISIESSRRKIGGVLLGRLLPRCLRWASSIDAVCEVASWWASMLHY